MNLGGQTYEDVMYTYEDQYDTMDDKSASWPVHEYEYSRTVQPKDTVTRRISDSGYECETREQHNPRTQ